MNNKFHKFNKKLPIIHLNVEHYTNRSTHELFFWFSKFQCSTYYWNNWKQGNFRKSRNCGNHRKISNRTVEKVTIVQPLKQRIIFFKLVTNNLLAQNALKPWDNIENFQCSKNVNKMLWIIKLENLRNFFDRVNHFSFEWTLIETAAGLRHFPNNFVFEWGKCLRLENFWILSEQNKNDCLKPVFYIHSNFWIHYMFQEL
jgi:hypothetical protein